MKPKSLPARPRAPADRSTRAFTVLQTEARHPGVAGRLRTWIHRADAGDASFAGLKPAILRIGRSVLIDEVTFTDFLQQRSGLPPAPDRRGGTQEDRS